MVSFLWNRLPIPFPLEKGGLWSTSGLLLLSVLLGSLFPLCVEAQVTRLAETYTSPKPGWNDRFGTALTDVGDVDGDGMADLGIGAPLGAIAGAKNPSRVYLINAAEGTAIRNLASPNPAEGGGFGTSVATFSSGDGDGPPTLLVGAPQESPGRTKSAGRAYLLDRAAGTVLRPFTSPAPEKYGSFGAAIAGRGDVNGDGTADLLVGAPKESPSGMESAGKMHLLSGADGTVLRTFTSPKPEKHGFFGSAVAEVGDVNGDDTADLLIGAPGESPGDKENVGRVYLLSGADGAVLRTLPPPSPSKFSAFGSAVAAFEDVSGDGKPDLLIGAPLDPAGRTEKAGRVYVLSGADGTVLHTLAGPNGTKGFGESVGTVGGRDGGLPDVLVGAVGAQSGRVYRFEVRLSPEKKAARLLAKRHPDLLKPKGEFETTKAYQQRQKKAEAKKQEILKELQRKRQKKIRESLTQVTLRIQKLEKYNADEKLFPITIRDTTYEVEIPLDEARSFDENWQEAKVVGYKQLTEDLSGYRYFNLKVVHPTTGSRYPIGPQEELDRRPASARKQVDPNELPETTASVSFTEPSGNNRLDGAETASVQVTVRNEGKGPAYQVQAAIEPSDHLHLSYPSSVSFGLVKAGTTATKRIQIQASRKIAADTVGLTFQFEEANGFAPSPVRLQFETQAFIPPKLTVADVGINDSNGNGVIEPGELVTVTARVKNASRGRAEGVSAQVNFGKNVFATPDTKQSFDLGSLGPGEHQDVQFSLVTNQQAESVPVTVDLTEKYGEFGKSGIKLPLAFNQPTDQITEVQVEGQDTNVQVQSGDQLSVDVETNIPTTPMERPDAVAVVIGIRRYPTEGVPNVKYARRDARVMRQYLTQMLGFREENILPRNPDGRMTYAEMRTLVQQKLPSYVKEGTSEVFVFYSGHGAPTTGENRQGYLVPSDTDPNFVSDANAYALKDFYGDLAKVGAKSITVVLDACFTGQSGSGEMMIRKASPSVLSVENPFLEIETGTAFLASSTEQVANWYPEKKHGLFTYFFLKGLKGNANLNGDQKVTVAEMESYLTDEKEGVPYYSRRLHQRKQMPQVVGRNKERVLVRYGQSSQSQKK